MIETLKVVYYEFSRDRIFIQFNDRNTFKIQAQSHNVTLNAILCQKGNL